MEKGSLAGAQARRVLLP